MATFQPTPHNYCVKHDRNVDPDSLCDDCALDAVEPWHCPACGAQRPVFTGRKLRVVACGRCQWAFSVECLAHFSALRRRSPDMDLLDAITMLAEG
jgi:hypothetical protein